MNLNHSLSNLTGATTFRNQQSMNQTSTSDASQSQIGSEVVFCKSHYSNLPIYDFRQEIVQRIIENPVTIITGKTGCGKVKKIETSFVPYLIIFSYFTDNSSSSVHPRQLQSTKG